MNAYIVGKSLAALVFVGLLGAAFYGWIMNIVTLFHADALTGNVILRAVGIFIAPLGAILGYL